LAGYGRLERVSGGVVDNEDSLHDVFVCGGAEVGILVVLLLFL